MEVVLFSQVTLLDPASPHHNTVKDIRVRDGRIEEIGASGSLVPLAGETVAQGGCVCPGWVDMRTHLTVPGHEYKEDLQSLAQAAMAGGFTRVVTMPNTHPVVDNAGQVRSLLMQAAGLPIYIHPAGAVSVGAKGADLAEMYDMHLAGAAAFTDGLNSVQSAGLMLNALQYLRPFEGLLIQTPFALSLSGTAEVAEGLNATMAGMKGVPALAEEMGTTRELMLVRHSFHKVHLGPVTTSVAVDLLRADKLESGRVSVETTALHLLLDDSVLLDFDGNTKVWPPLRSASDVEALRRGVLDGTIDVISSSHHPQSTEEKLHDFVDAAFGAEMLETAFAAARTALDSPEGLQAIARAMGANPRQIMGLPQVVIAEGGFAELTHFDPDLSWTPAVRDLRSKARNNPLLGKLLKGKPLGVLVKGKYHAVGR